jgi:hypothetical protein
MESGAAVMLTWSKAGVIAEALGSIGIIFTLLYSVWSFTTTLRDAYYAELDRVYFELLKIGLEKPELLTYTSSGTSSRPSTTAAKAGRSDACARPGSRSSPPKTISTAPGSSCQRTGGGSSNGLCGLLRGSTRWREGRRKGRSWTAGDRLPHPPLIEIGCGPQAAQLQNPEHRKGVTYSDFVKRVRTLPGSGSSFLGTPGVDRARNPIRVHRTDTPGCSL